MTKHVLWVVGFLMVSGCGGSLPQSQTPALPASIRKIHIPVFMNKTFKPNIEAEFTDLVIREFQKDQRLQVVALAEADAVLVGALDQYIKDPTAYDVNNVPIQYQIRVRLSIRIVDRATQKVVVEHDNVGGLSGGTSVFSVSPQAGINLSTETEAQREAFEKLAKDVVNRTIYGWEKF